MRSLFLHQASVFTWLLWRDLYCFLDHWKRVLVNFGIFVPVTLTFSFGYLLPNSNMVLPTPAQTTVFFVGSILWAMFPLAFLLNYDVLYDFENDRFIDYQITVLNPRLLIVEKIVFSTIITFVHMLLFYPVSRLLLGSYFYAPQFSWPSVLLILLCGSLFCSAFNMFCISFLESTEKLGIFWMRINNPMIMLGGLFVPWSIVAHYNKLLGFLLLGNPLTYLTEGLRQAIIGGEQFFSLLVCTIGLLLYACLFTVLAVYFFKRKVDHI
jgi:ABC-type multidrug transport system permease subunit